jgi:signal transduction histidine kinase
VDTDEAFKAKDRFVNLVVHDLRAPLSTCMLTVQQLRQELTDFANSHGIPEATERRLRFASMFDGMTNRATDMLRMIDQILLGSRIRSGRLVPNLRPVSKTRIQSVVDSLEPLSRQKGIALTCALPEDFRLLADPDLLAEVIQNLLTNAIKFTSADGTIHVGALNAEHHGLFVRDSGVGIPAEVIPMLCKSESRYTTSGTVGEKGTGMGLAMCDDIVTAHGGRLEVSSTQGMGTEVRVYLPQSLPRLLAVGIRSEDEPAARAVAEALQGELMLAAPGDALSLAIARMPQAVLFDGTSPSAAAALLALRADPVLRGVPVLWLGATLPPVGQIPDDRLDSPLDASALREALRASFGA